MSRILDYNLFDLTPSGGGKKQKELEEKINQNTDDIVEINKKLENIEAELSILNDMNRGHIYGAKRLIQDAEGNLNSDPSWIRFLDSKNWIVNANKAILGDLRNDANNVYPYNQILSCNMNSQNQVVAWYGNSNFKFDGSNGDVMTRFPRAWYYRARVYDSLGNLWEIEAVADYAVKNFFEVKTFYLSRYKTCIVNGEAHSYSGYIPETARNIENFRNLVTAKSDKHCLVDWRHFIISILFHVEYAHNNIQAVLGNGAISYRRTNADVSLVAEENTNRIIINTASGNGFKVGQNIHIGKTDVGQTNVVKDRTVTSKEAYSEGDITGIAIYFDGDPVNIAVGNIIGSSPMTTGGCDELGMKSGCIKNDNYSSMIYKGLEDYHCGSANEFVDGMVIDYLKAKICTDYTKYSSTDFSAYEEVDYINLGDTGVYPIANGCDKREGTVFSLIAFPEKAGGSTTTGICDVYYCTNAANRVVYGGGSCGSGTSGGLGYWNLSYAFSYANDALGARFLINT